MKLFLVQLLLIAGFATARLSACEVAQTSNQTPHIGIRYLEIIPRDVRVLIVTALAKSITLSTTDRPQALGLNPTIIGLRSLSTMQNKEFYKIINSEIMTNGLIDILRNKIFCNGKQTAESPAEIVLITSALYTPGAVQWLKKKAADPSFRRSMESLAKTNDFPTYTYNFLIEGLKTYPSSIEELLQYFLSTGHKHLLKPLSALLPNRFHRVSIPFGPELILFKK